MVLTLCFLMVLVTMVYGPMAAALVELFPTRIRYTSMSLPYHIGNGWFGGLLPASMFAMNAQNGSIYFGLWYPIVIAAGTAVIGAVRSCRKPRIAISSPAIRRCIRVTGRWNSIRTPPTTETDLSPLLRDRIR